MNRVQTQKIIRFTLALAKHCPPPDTTPAKVLWWLEAAEQFRNLTSGEAVSPRLSREGLMMMAQLRSRAMRCGASITFIDGGTISLKWESGRVEIPSLGFASA